jgi:hypothetical protein
VEADLENEEARTNVKRLLDHFPEELFDALNPQLTPQEREILAAEKAVDLLLNATESVESALQALNILADTALSEEERPKQLETPPSEKEKRTTRLQSTIKRSSTQRPSSAETASPAERRSSRKPQLLPRPAEDRSPVGRDPIRNFIDESKRQAAEHEDAPPQKRIRTPEPSTNAGGAMHVVDLTDSPAGRVRNPMHPENHNIMAPQPPHQATHTYQINGGPLPPIKQEEQQYPTSSIREISYTPSLQPAPSHTGPPVHPGPQSTTLPPLPLQPAPPHGGIRTNLLEPVRREHQIEEKKPRRRRSKKSEEARTPAPPLAPSTSWSHGPPHGGEREMYRYGGDGPAPFIEAYPPPRHMHPISPMTPQASSPTFENSARQLPRLVPGRAPQQKAELAVRHSQYSQEVRRDEEAGYYRPTLPNPPLNPQGSGRTLQPRPRSPTAPLRWVAPYNPPLGGQGPLLAPRPAQPGPPSPAQGSGYSYDRGYQNPPYQQHQYPPPQESHQYGPPQQVPYGYSLPPPSPSQQYGQPRHGYQPHPYPQHQHAGPRGPPPYQPLEMQPPQSQPPHQQAPPPPPPPPPPPTQTPQQSPPQPQPAHPAQQSQQSPEGYASSAYHSGGAYQSPYQSGPQPPRREDVSRQSSESWDRERDREREREKERDRERETEREREKERDTRGEERKSEGYERIERRDSSYGQQRVLPPPPVQRPRSESVSGDRRV